MDALALVLLVILAVLLAAAFYFITVYNRLQSLRNGAEATLSQIRVAMKNPTSREIQAHRSSA